MFLPRAKPDFGGALMGAQGGFWRPCFQKMPKNIKKSFFDLILQKMSPGEPRAKKMSPGLFFSGAKKK